MSLKESEAGKGCWHQSTSKEEEEPLSGSSNSLRQRLRTIGLADAAINAAWPAWWSDEAEFSSSARAELRFSVARKLGLDPRSLLEDEGAPRFVWRDEARFKHLADEGDLERAAITSFGTAVGTVLVNATNQPASISGYNSIDLRQAILNKQVYVRLLDLLALCWSAGIPVIHLRVFPCTRKRMAAMSVRIEDRNAILLGKDSAYPAHIAFYVAHELGHILSGHLASHAALVDLDYADLTTEGSDSEEVDADRFALELLTGQPRPTVLPWRRAYNSRELARTVLEASKELAVEPGTLALCFGYSTRDWATANAAMQLIYASGKPVWNEVNNVAIGQLDIDLIPEDTRAYLEAILGSPK